MFNYSHTVVIPKRDKRNIISFLEFSQFAQK